MLDRALDLSMAKAKKCLPFKTPSNHEWFMLMRMCDWHLSGESLWWV